MLSVGQILNRPNNAYERAMYKYLQLQDPKPQMINGLSGLYIPAKPWSTTGKPPKNRKPSEQWAPYETKFRAPVKVTSTAFETIRFDAYSKMMQYKFRKNYRVYSRPMSRDLWNMFITSSSLGKFYNRYMRMR